MAWQYDTEKVKPLNKQQLQALHIPTYEEFLAEFERQAPAMQQRGDAVLKDAVAQLGLKPNFFNADFSKRAITFHRQYFQSADFKKYYEAYRTGMEKQRQRLVASAGNIAEDSYARTLVLTSLDKMFDYYQAAFFWPHFRLTALHELYHRELVQSGTVDQKTIQKVTEAAYADVEKWLKAPLFLTMLSHYGDHMPSPNIAGHLGRICKIQQLSNLMLYYLEPDKRYGINYALGHDPVYTGHFEKRLHIADDFTHDWGDKFFRHLGKVGRSGENYQFEFRVIADHPAKLALTQAEADTVAKVLELDEKDKKALNDCVKASDALKSFLLRARLGDVMSWDDFGKIRKGFEDAERSFLKIVEHPLSLSRQDRSSLPKEVLGCHLTGEGYKRSKVSDYYFGHVLGEMSIVFSPYMDRKEQSR